MIMVSKGHNVFGLLPLVHVEFYQLLLSLQDLVLPMADVLQTHYSLLVDDRP